MMSSRKFQQKYDANGRCLAKRLHSLHVLLCLPPVFGRPLQKDLVHGSLSSSFAGRKELESGQRVLKSVLTFHALLVDDELQIFTKASIRVSHKFPIKKDDTTSLGNSWSTWMFTASEN